MIKTAGAVLCCVLMFGCAKPTDPESLTPTSGGYSVVAKFHTPAYAQDVEVRDSIAFVAQGEGGLAVVSIADRTRPRLLSVCQEGVRGYSYKVALKDSAAYVAAGGFGVNVIDVNNPMAPFATASNLAMKPAQSFHVFGNYLLTAIGESGVKVAEVSMATIPDIRGELSNPGYAIGLTTTSDSAYLLVACGEMGFAIYDVRDMQGGFGPYREVGWLDTPGYANDVAVMPNRSIAYLACGTSGVQVVDFSDTNAIRLVGSYATGGYAKEIMYDRGRLYVTTEMRGLQVFSVENPVSPRFVGAVDTEYALGVAVDQRYVYVADEDEGLLIIAIPPY